MNLMLSKLLDEANEKLNNEFRVQICVSSLREMHPSKVVPSALLSDKELLPYLRIDVDPYSFL